MLAHSLKTRFTQAACYFREVWENGNRLAITFTTTRQCRYYDNTVFLQNNDYIIMFSVPTGKTLFAFLLPHGYMNPERIFSIVAVVAI